MIIKKIKNTHLDSFPPDTRIWIYQSATILSNDQIEKIEIQSNQFINDWTAHGTKLKAGIAVFHNLFIVVFADEKQAIASGCSIDKSVKFIHSIEKDLNISLLDRMQVAYLENEELKVIHLNKFKEALQSNSISKGAKVFNNLINTKKEFENKWLVPIMESWHKKLF
jgi:hypothetical protein